MFINYIVFYHLQTLNVSDRNLILKFNKEKRRPDIVKPTFKPELNKKS